MFKYTVLFLFIGLSYADDKNSGYIVTCPAIQTCKVADSPTQNRAYAKINQEAYDCYRYTGETDLAESAAIATTKCMAIYGSNSAAVIANDSKVN